MAAIRGIGALLVVGVFAACDRDPIGAANEVEWQGTIQGRPGWEHLSGDAAFRWRQDLQHFTAGIALAGDEPGAVRPWHVHFNTCAQGGGIVGGDAEYPRLTIGSDGSASAVTDVAFIPNPAVAYHVNVHLSDAEMDVIIACGDLPLVGGQGGSTGEPSIPGY